MSIRGYAELRRYAGMESPPFRGFSISAAQQVVDETTALGGVTAPNHDSVAAAVGGKAIVQAAIDAFGRVHIVVNNAGILRD
jgi:NAD(P)-dependent dehydrogenase (short-subunit alcohol dehydrogenase family)